MDDIIRGYRIRIYPNEKQKNQIWQHIGACRFLWNHMLYIQNGLRENREDRMSGFDMVRMITPMKRSEEYSWLKDISIYSLQHTCIILGNDFTSFFKGRSGHPKFKTKKATRPSYPVDSDAFYFTEKTVQVAKLGKVKYKTDYDLPYGKEHKFSNALISFYNGKYFLSFGMECESQARELTKEHMGIDLGIKELAVAAYGDKQVVFHNINKSKRVRYLKKRIKHTHKVISRKYNKNGNFEKTNNIIKKEDLLRKLYGRLHGIWNNHIHQATHTLVSMLPDRVTTESLNVHGMMKNKHLSKAVQEQGFYEFIRQMKYKCAWNGIEFIQADRYFPSSKTCSACGGIKKDLRLRDRTYVCPNCGAIIDRDYNAAINLMRYADLHSQAVA